MSPRQTYTLDEIKDRLLGQIDSVVAHYAPYAEGSFTDKGKYFTLNPGRADKSVGSFVIRMDGKDAGRWNDYATGSFGDILDLINLAMHGEGTPNNAATIKEARAWLGLDTESPEVRRAREKAAEQGRARRAQADRDAEKKRARRRRWAQRLWLGGVAELRDTPVDFYLKGRGVDLAMLGRVPGAIRYIPSAKYKHIDNDTGEVIEGSFACMGTAIVDWRGDFAGIHRTFLAQVDGKWIKAPVPEPKMVLGDAWKNGINIWRGTGPRGGRGCSLPQCPPDTHVYLTEGIEDALSVAILLPDHRVVAAISLGNLGAINLPQNVTRPASRRNIARPGWMHRAIPGSGFAQPGCVRPE